MCEEQLWLHGRKVPKGSPCIIIGGTTPCIQLVHPTGDVTIIMQAMRLCPAAYQRWRACAAAMTCCTLCANCRPSSRCTCFSERGAASLTPLDYELPLALTDTFSRATWLRELCVELSMLICHGQPVGCSCLHRSRYGIRVPSPSILSHETHALIMCRHIMCTSDLIIGTCCNGQPSGWQSTPSWLQS